MNWRKVRTFLITLFVLLLIPATRFYQIDEPLWRMVRGEPEINPLALHVAGEFVENNLGTQQNLDGSVTVRMIAEQYLFVPHCVIVPAGAQVHLRITSADAVHMLAFNGAPYTLKASPGSISKADLRFSNPGEYKTACREFCGAGHYAMRSEWKVVPADQFPHLTSEQRGDCAAE